MTSTKAQIVPHSLKVLAILSDATARRSAVIQEDWKSNWNPEGEDQQVKSFSKILLTI